MNALDDSCRFLCVFVFNRIIKYERREGMKTLEVKNWKQIIIEKAKEIGIDKIGFATAEPFDYLEKSLYKQQAAGHSTGFEHKNTIERLYPDLIFDDAQSIISICLAYPSTISNPYPQSKEERRGLFARASWGIDYHDILRDRMEKLTEFMSQLIPDIRFKSMVDTGELSDVAVAERAGLGFIGRNGLLITEEFGTFVYLGEIITNIPFQPDSRVPFGCGDCYRCVTACPTNALLGDGRMDGQRCLSYQTQTKGFLDDEYRRKITHVIYGCDICQIACPYNNGIDKHFHKEMEPDPDKVQPALKPMLQMSNKEFKHQFGELAGSWRGKKPLQRNAIIALANYRDQTALPKLLEVIETDPRPMIRATAAYAVSQIQKYFNFAMIQLIQAQIEKEEDSETIAEMERAVKVLQKKRPAR